MRRLKPILREGILALVAATAVSSPSTTASAGVIPERFVNDTIYHVVIDIPRLNFTLNYGGLPLVQCPFSLLMDSSDVAAFEQDWEDRSSRRWRSVNGRVVFVGQPQVSDTVVEVVSRIAHADPNMIRRVLPDRFSIRLSAGVSLLVTTPAGDTLHGGIREFYERAAEYIAALGRLHRLKARVSPGDAQILYYALEPGTPVLLITTHSVN